MGFKQIARMFLLVALSITSVQLYNSWESSKTKSNVSTADAKVSTQKTESFKNKAHHDLPDGFTDNNKLDMPDVVAEDESSRNGRLITISTDVMEIRVDRLGGDIVYLELLDYPAKLDSEEKFVLFDESSERNFIAQSGLLHELGPDSHSKGKALYTTENSKYSLSGDELKVDLNFTTKNNINVVKRFIFSPGSYEVKLEYLVENNSSQNYIANIFSRLKRENIKEQKSSFLLGSASRNYIGAAINTPESRYKKISFSDMQKNNFKQQVPGGWIAMIEHYFTASWIPENNSLNTFVSESFGNNIYGISFIGAPINVAPGASHIFKTKLFAGPEIADILSQASPGLELTIDYGFLWFLSQPIFWLLRNVYQIMGNWGVSIIITTVLIKLAFYKLSASSYRSMGNMRKLQPKMEALKGQYGDDKQGYGQAILALYKQEKVNPLGGCLPVLIQVPVFISLYYVLLESVELRQSPFLFWIQDLSMKDPYYVLPIVMGITMFVQQKFNPTPADPMQAKVMQFMPLIFTFLFLSFPSGLVLYWVVNNILSILQQWYITRNITANV